MVVDRILFEGEEPLMFGVSGVYNRVRPVNWVLWEENYSSNLCSGSAPITQFCGHSPPSTYRWE